jgi:hypothetical protein
MEEKFLRILSKFLQCVMNDLSIVYRFLKHRDNMYILGTYFLSLYHTLCKFLHIMHITLILKKNGVHQQTLPKISIMKLHKNPSNRGRIVSRGETDGQNEALDRTS